MKKTFTILIAAIAAILMMTLPEKAVGQTRTTMTFDFEDSGAHTTTTNSYGTHTYTENGVNINTTYFDCISNSGIGGSYLARGRVAQKTTRSPELTIGPIDVTGWTITSITYYTKGATTINQVFKTKTDTDSDYVTQITTYATPSTSTQKTATVSITGKTSLYLKWIGSVSSQTNSNRDFDIDDIVITYTTSGGGTTTAAPSISGDTPFLNNTTVTITNDASATGANIYYTLNGDAPTTTTTATCFAYSEPFSITATTTVKAIAKKSTDTNASSVVTKTFTKITPLANIAALSSQTEAGTYYVTLDDAVVTFTNGYYAYIQDESGAILYYKNGHGLSAGQRFTGTANVTLAFDNNNPEITTLSGVTPTSGDAPEPTTVVASAWNYTFNNVLSQYIKITDAQITNTSGKYYVSVGSAKAVQSIQLYGRGDANNFSISNLSLDDRFTIVGFPTLYKSTNEFVIFAVPQKEDIYIGSSSAIQLSYAANASGSMTVGYSNFTPTSVTAALYSDSGCSSSFSGDWISITSPLTTPFTSLAYNVSANETGADRTVYMKINATNANGTIIHKIFTITQVLHQTYSVTYKANGGTGEDVVDSPYDYNATVTVKPNNGTGSNPGFSKTGYTFQNWNTNAGGTGTTYNPNSTFNITANIDLYAKWQANTYDLNVDDDMENGSISFKVGGSAAQTAQTGQTVTIVITPASGYKYTSSSLTVTNDDTHESVSVSNTNTFTMPANSVTVSAEFEVYYALTIDFESDDIDSYTDWTFSGVTTYGTHNDVDAYEGSYFGTTGGNNPAYLQTANKIANPQSLSCYVSKQTKNTTSSTWEVYVSSNGTEWGDAIASQDATSMSIGGWVELSADLSSYSNVFVRIKYSGSTAVRCIDAVVLEYEPSEYAVTLSSVSGGTISASDGTTTITSGSGNFETGKTITLTAEGDATHMFSAWTVTGATVDDASSATTTFEMPANAVTVSATFVECWTFTYNINGNVVTEKYAKNGASITLPTTSEYVPEGYSIIGWTATEGDVSSPITSATANQDRNLFAVFGKITFSDFTLVESAPSNWSGYYLIVYNNSTTLNTHSNNLDVNSYGTTASIAAYYDNKVIKSNSTTVQYIVKIEQTTNGYSIYAKDGYLGYNQTTSGTGGTGTYLRWDTEFTSSQNEWTIGVGSIVSCYYSSRAIRYNSSANPARFAIYATTGQDPIQLFKTTVSNEGAYTHIYPSNATATGDINVGSTGPIVIESGATLNMGSYSLTNVDAAKLVIEDGAQLILPKTNTGVQATVKKEIHEATAKDATYWYAISSAVANPSIASATNIASGTYDLYRYNEAAELTNAQGQTLYWENYKAGHVDFTTLEPGRGYLYRNASNLSITMTGEINVADFNYEVTKTGSGVLAGFNLIGNPYSHDIYKGDGTAILNGTDFLRTGFYYMNPADGSWTPGTDGFTAIKPNQGILVQTDKSGKIEMTNTNSNGAKYNNDNIMFKVANSQYSDETYAWFDKGRGLNKISHRNAEVPMIYINQDGEDYAIATMSDDTKMFSLNFKAMTMGKYTLSYKTRGEFNYLHVIDRLTGEDVDMLLEGEYSFVASPSDSDARFIVKLAYLPDYSDGEGDIFAYQNGSDIFVSGEGELQIFDVMGRFVMSERINGVTTISADELSKGVYVLRLVGNGMKTQKIVVK